MKATKKDVTITDYNEELVTFAETIDFTDLFNHIRTCANISCGFDAPEISTNRSGEVFIRFMSADITSQTGAFAPILKHCYIGSFSNGVYKDKKTSEIGYWVNVTIQYEHKGGGRNGMEVADAWYTETKGWIFEDVKSN